MPPPRHSTAQTHLPAPQHASSVANTYPMRKSAKTPHKHCLVNRSAAASRAATSEYTAHPTRRDGWTVPGPTESTSPHDCRKNSIESAPPLERQRHPNERTDGSHQQKTSTSREQPQAVN